jgi:BirA family biotin operon repressor/biotin-[acetyl-CoA-carboxylase] ligase
VIYHYPTIDSTMRIAAGLEIGDIVTADEQTAGQGRYGHSWHSERSSGLYCSFVLPPTPLLTLALGLAARDAISQTTGIVCDLRWPNDLMLAERKLGGILVQLADGKAIGGIGINVNHTMFPRHLQSEATSLHLHAGREFDRSYILDALRLSIPKFTSEKTGMIIRLFTNASSYASGRRVTVDQPDGVIEGTTAGLDSSGFLIVRKDDGTDALIVAGGVRAAGS